MLGKSKTTVTTSETPASIGTIIGPKAVFDGNLDAPESVRIDGIVKGNCISKANLILGAEGEITGNITARDVTISGKVTGDIVASGKLELLSTGHVSGNITALSLIIDENAFFDGHCTMKLPGKETPAPAAEEPPKQAKSVKSKISEPMEADEELE